MIHACNHPMFVDDGFVMFVGADAVVRARHEGHSWAAIGAMVGTSGEAARQRYGRAVNAG